VKKILAPIGLDNVVRVLTLMVIVTISFVVPLSAATYHVDCNHLQASDSNPGTQERPWKTISKAAARLKPGDMVIVHGGVYREWVHPQRSGTKDAPISYIAAPGEEVIITGADIFTDWQRVEGDRPIYTYEPWTLYSVIDPPEQMEIPSEGLAHPWRYSTSPPDPTGRQEQVICDGKLLRHVLNLEEMEPGTFLSDIEHDVLYIWLPNSASSAAHTVEVSVRTCCFGLKWGERVDYIVVKGFTMRYGRNRAQHGLLSALGNHWIVEDNIIEWSNATGLGFNGKDHIIRNNTMQYNGERGMGGSHAIGCLLEGNKLLYNNVKGYPTHWNAAGCKFFQVSDIAMSDTVAIGNIGPGIWFDGDCRSCTVTRSLCKDNTRWGIYVEISGKGGIKLTDNICVGNGFGDPLAPLFSAGIGIDYSEHCVVENNILMGNNAGLAIIMISPPRTPIGQEGEKVSYYTHDNTIRRNIIAFNLDYQFVFHNPGGTPPLDPEKLNFIIDNNLYYGFKDRILVQYGCGWRPESESFTSLADWQAAHPFDHNSIFADPLFVDLERLDLHLKLGSPAFQLGFQPIDLSAVGPVSPPEGVEAPERPPLIPQGPIMDEGFEYTPVGALPIRAGMILEEEGASARVTDEQAATGRHSLKFADVPSSESDWKPQMSYLPHFTEGRVRLSFNLRLEPGAIAWMEWLDMAMWGMGKVGPKLEVDEAGRLKASGSPLLTVPLGQWFHVEIVCGLGPQATGFYDLTVTVLGQEPKVFSWFPCVDWNFRLLRRLVIVSQATQSTAFYLDNVKWEAVKE